MVFGGLAHPNHFGNTQPVRIQSGGDCHQPRHRAGHHTVGTAKRPQRQELPVCDRSNHRRRCQGGVGYHIREQLQTRANVGIGPRTPKPIVIDLVGGRQHV
ncbi:Uncharacterised protein [Mycobacterium tuberculosis]|nr:Uncharacterised protein [Mycobacterium tuberculosis]